MTFGRLIALIIILPLGLVALTTVVLYDNFFGDDASEDTARVRVIDTTRGHCVDERELENDNGAQFITRTPCNKAHTGEIFYEGILPIDSSVFPGKAKVKAAADAICAKGAKINEQSFHRPKDELAFRTLAPNKATWTSSPEIRCVVSVKGEVFASTSLLK